MLPAFLIYLVCYNPCVMKMKKTLRALLCAALLAGCTSGSSSAAAPGAQTQMNTYTNASLDAGFDTVISLRETTASRDDFDAHFTEMTELFSKYNALFDIYNDYDGVNNIKTINDNAGKAPVKVDPVIIEMLQEAKEFYDLSDGEFDVTSGALLSVWHKYREEGIALNEEGKQGSLPSQDELEQAAQHKGWDSIIIDEDASTVYITDPEVSLDVGGIAKGFATEKAAQQLEEDGADHAAVNAGGNNRTIGAKINGKPWNVGIQNPDGEGSVILVSVPGSMSFVTSGDYERFYTADDGQRYSHIIDPETLMPAKNFRSVSIITQDSGIADCLSTTLFTMSYEEGLALIRSYKEAHPDITLEAIWIMDQDKAVKTEHSHDISGYTIACTEGLEDLITWQNF